MGGMLNILATLLSVVVAIPGKVSNRACQLSSFSDNEVEWNLPCFRVSENSGQSTQSVLNFLDLSTPLSTPIEEQKQIIISMADDIMKLHYIESVYYYFCPFLVWLKNVQIAVENYKTGSTDLCRWFIRRSFQMTLQDAGYKGLLQLRSESISFNETRLQRFFQDLPIAVLTHYMNDLEYHHKPTFSELEGILSKQIQNSFDSLKSDENHGIITNISEQISSDLLSVLSAALSNINSLVVSGDITFLVETERWATGKYVEACTENAVEWETKILQSLQNLTNALHTSSSDILNLMLSLLHQSDSTSEGDDPQFYLKSTPSEGVNSTQNYNKASAKTHSATNQDDAKTKAMANNDEGNYEKQKTTITSSENARTTHTIPVGGTNGKDQTTGKQGEDPPEGGTNDKDQTTGKQGEDPPEQPEYRAYFNQSQQQPYVFQTGANDVPVYFTLNIYALGARFGDVSKDDVSFNRMNVRSFRDEASITMTVEDINRERITVLASADASAKWSFTMAINDQPVLNDNSPDPLKVDLEVQHEAPTCLSYRFTDLGNAIKFLFNVAVNVIRNADRDCTELFEDVSKLGKGATCDMTTPWSLLVTIGGGTNLIKSGDILIFKQDTFKPARQMFYRTFPARNFSIQAPNTQQRLSFTITGPTRINSCGNYQLRAEQISGHGGRPVTYQWQLWNESIPYGLNEGNQSPEVSINAAGILPGNYSVSLNITNFLQQSHTQNHVLIVLDDIKPTLEIKPLNVIPDRVRASSRVKLEAVLTFSFGDDCKTTGDVPKYEWSSSGDIIIPEELSKNRILVLPPNTLPVGRNIHITVSVSLTGAKGPTTVTEDIQLTTVSSPLVAQIIGASILTLGPDETVTLNGSRSHDPDEQDSRPLNFQWACFVASSENSCNSYLKSPLTLPELSITSSQFTEGTYSIILTVSKDTSTSELRRTAFVSATLVIVNDRVPVISIKTVEGKTKYRHDRSIYIQANVKSSSNVTIAWREENDRLQPERSSLVRRQNEFITHVKIPHDQTTPGSKYTIEVIAIDENGKTGLATLNLEIYNPITQCEVHATSYIELGEITINATGCVADPDLEPLTYQPVFALPVKSGFKKIVLGGSKSDSEQRVIASPINYNEGQVYVGFMICDASSTCIDEFHITDYVPAKEITPSEQQEYITHNVDEVLERGDIATAFRNVINIANLLKKTSLPTRRRRRDTEVQFTFQGNLDSVFLVVNGQTVQVNGNDAETQFKIELAGKQAMVFFSVRPVDVNEGALVSDLSSQMMISMFTEEEIDEVLRTIRRILDKARDEGALYSKDTIERLLTTLKMSEENLRSNRKETKERRKTARNLREMALKQAGQHLNIDEHVTFDVLGTQMFVAYSFPKHEVTLTNDSVHRVNARLGRNLSNSYGYDWCGNSQSETCVGIKVMATQMDSLETKIDKCTDIFRVGLLNPVTDEQLSDLEEPIEIEMAMNQVGKDERCVCKCWNEDTSQLEDDGVTSETTADGKLICKSRRPATFVGARELNSSADRREGRQRAGIPKLQKRHPGVILGIVFGILLLIIVAVAIAVMVLKANAKKKVTPAGKKFEEEKSDISEADNP